MPRTDSNHRWEDYKNMIAKRAWQFSQQFGLDFQELQSEGNLIFVMACRGHKAGGAAFGTYLWKCLTNGLLKFCQRERRQANYDLTTDGELPDGRHDGHSEIDRSLYLRQSFACLPTTAVNTILTLATRPEDLGLKMTEPPRAVRTAVRNQLLAEGDTWSIARASMKTLKQLHAEVM